MRQLQEQLQAWSQEHRQHDVLEAPNPEVTKQYGKCVHCGKPMTKLEAQGSVKGSEDRDNLTCDECLEAITLEIAEGTPPSVFEDVEMRR